MGFWERYVLECEKIGKKPTPMAMEMGFSNATATKWKNGALPDGSTLIKLAEKFSVSIDYLVGRVDRPDEYAGHEDSEDFFEAAAMGGLDEKTLKAIEAEVRKQLGGKK